MGREPVLGVEQLKQQGCAEHYDKHADRYWEDFYVRNDDRFFRDRHYLQHEFPELTEGPITVFEVMHASGLTNTVAKQAPHHECV